MGRKPSLLSICIALFLETLAYTIVVPVYAKFAAQVMAEDGGGGSSAEDRAASFTAFWNVVGNMLKFVSTPIVGRTLSPPYCTPAASCGDILTLDAGVSTTRYGAGGSFRVS